MDGKTIALIVVVVLLALVVVGLLARAAGKKRTEQHRGQANVLRSEAAAHASTVQDSQLRAQEAEADAERKRVQAERAAAEAARAKQGAQVEQAGHEDRIREADRIDPDVNHQSDDYQPQAGVNPAGQSDHPPVDPDYDTRVPEDPTRADRPATDPVADPGALNERPPDGAHRA
jgi:FtsZ-interacting cell division protein ZipA